MTHSTFLNASASTTEARVMRLKLAARGRIREILTEVANIPSQTVEDESTREYPCPKCGGNTRFRVFKDDSGGCLCSHCFNKENGDFIATVQWALGVPFIDAIERIERHLGIVHDMVKAVCEEKKIPSVDALLAFGARTAMRGQLKVARVDVYNEAGQIHSHYDLAPGMKGLAKKGKGTSGVFLPGRKPEPGEEWLVVEGVKDAAACYSLGFCCMGAWQNKLHPKYFDLLRGANVTFVPDRDRPSMEGFLTSAANLSGVAASVRIAELPGELRDADGIDVRDVLATEGGESLVRAAIDNSRDWREFEAFLPRGGRTRKRKSSDEASPSSNGETQSTSSEGPSLKIEDDDPHRLAEIYLSDERHDGEVTLARYRSDWLRWRNGRWVTCSDEMIRGEVVECIRLWFRHVAEQELQQKIESTAGDLQ